MKKPSSSTSGTGNNNKVVGSVGKTKDKSVPCPDCGKVYSNRANMKQHQNNRSCSANNNYSSNSKPKSSRPRVLITSDSDSNNDEDGQNYDHSLNGNNDDNDSYTKLPSTNNTITVQASKRQKCTLVGASKRRPSSTTTITSRRLDRATKPESSTNQHFTTQNGGDLTNKQYVDMLNEPFQTYNITELLYAYDYYNYNKYKQTLIDEDMSQGSGQNYDSSNSNTNTTSTNNTNNSTTTTNTSNMIIETTATEQWVDQEEDDDKQRVHSRCMNPINTTTTTTLITTTTTVSKAVFTTTVPTSSPTNQQSSTEAVILTPPLTPPLVHHKQAPLHHRNIALKCGLLCYIYYWSKPVLSHTQIEELGPNHIHYRMPHVTVHTLFNMIDALPVSREEMYNIDTCKYMLEIPAEYEGFDVYTNNTTNTNSSDSDDEENRGEEVEKEEVLMMEKLRKEIILINQEYRQSLSLTPPATSPLSPSNIVPTLSLVTTTNGTTNTTSNDSNNGNNNTRGDGSNHSHTNSLYNTDVRVLFAPIAATVGEEYIAIIRQYLDSRSFPSSSVSPIATTPVTSTTPTTTPTALTLTTTTAAPTTHQKRKMQFPSTLELAYQFESSKADWPEGLEGAIDGLKEYLRDREEGSLCLPLSFMDFTAFMQV